MIERNRHPAGRISNMVFGLAQLADGLTRLMSMGFLHTTLTVDWARRQAKHAIARQVALRRDAKKF